MKDNRELTMNCTRGLCLIALVAFMLTHDATAFNGNSNHDATTTARKSTALHRDAIAMNELSTSDSDSAIPLNEPNLISTDDIRTISQGGVAVLPNWLPPHLIQSMRADARNLFKTGQFQPDGLTNTARSRDEQGFTQKADRQTFRGGAGWDSEVGDKATRDEFANRMKDLRRELAIRLDRPTLETEGVRKHEMTYNWYEPGARLGRHLDEHHEETKGVKGWLMPTRRSVTWLVYLNDGWEKEEGGALRCFPRDEKNMSTDVQVGSHEGNLQVGWVNGCDPVFLDCFRPSGGAALYYLAKSSGKDLEKLIISVRDFDVPAQPIEFGAFLTPQTRKTFTQISTSRLDPRFAAPGNVSTAKNSDFDCNEERTILDVTPAAGTLVLFDSVSLPHLVREVTGNRQRIAATGWFHEDSQFVLDI